MLARQAQGLPGIQQGAGKFAYGIVFLGNAVLDDHTHHAMLRRPSGDVRAFLVNGHEGVASARKDAQGRAFVPGAPPGGKIKLHLRFPHVRDPGGINVFFLHVRRLEFQRNPVGDKGGLPGFRGQFLRVAEKESAPDEAGTKISETAQKRDGMFMVCWQWK